MSGRADWAQVKKQLMKKYGKEFVEKAERDEGGLVNERVKHKLSIRVSGRPLAAKHMVL